MPALRLSTEIWHYRDGDKDNKAEEQGKLYKANTNANFHTVTYDLIKDNKKILNRIGGWSTMCQVINNVEEYSKIIDFVYNNGGVADYALLKEF